MGSINFNVFCKIDFLHRNCRSRLVGLFRNLSYNFLIYCDKDKASEEYTVLFRAGLPLQPCIDCFRRIENNDFSFLKSHPYSMLILDISKSEAKEVEQRYGIVCLTEEDALSFDLINKAKLIQCVKGNNAHSWSDYKYLSEHNLSWLVINDRYMLHKEESGICNLCDYITSCTQEDMNGIIVVVVGYNETQVANDLGDIVCKAIRTLRPLATIAVSLFSISKKDKPNEYKRTHNRFIVSNRYIISAEHMLAAFDSKKAATCTQVIMGRDMLYSLSPDSDLPLKGINQSLSDMFDFLKKNSLQTYLSSEDSDLVECTTSDSFYNGYLSSIE